MQQAANAKEISDSANELESLTLAVNGAILISDNYEVEANLLESELANYFDTANYSISEEDSQITVTIGVKRYVITTSGSITQIADDWYGDGSTTEYYISEASQLCELSDIVNNGEDNFKNKTIYLTSNIDMNEAYDEGYIFDVIGRSVSNATIFWGTFDGQNHEISNFNSPVDIDGDNYTSSMFLTVCEGSVKNLGIINSTFTGTSNAAVFTMFVDGGTIENCWSIDNSITGNKEAAGIVCDCMYGSTIKNCYNSSTVTSLTTSTNPDNGAGGICASSIDGDSGSIINCYNTGTIIAENGCAGGIAGYDSINSFISCYNTGTINGKYAGGIIGYAGDVTIRNCYNVGTISDTATYGGGIIGLSCYVDNSIANSYCLTNFYGHDDNTDIDITDVMENCGENVSTDDMKATAMITKLNTDMETGASAYVQDTNEINGGYPILSWQQ